MTPDEPLYGMIRCWRSRADTPEGERRCALPFAGPSPTCTTVRVVGGLGLHAGPEIDQWQDGYPDTGTLGRDIEIGQLYVVAEGDGVAGLGRAVPGAGADVRWDRRRVDPTEGPYLTVHRMALDDDSRGRGLAREKCIARAFETLARGNG